jgi:uncharacterized radical SAM superfamily protein
MLQINISGIIAIEGLGHFGSKVLSHMVGIAMRKLVKRCADSRNSKGVVIFVGQSP